MLEMNPDKVCFVILRFRELQESDLIEDPDAEAGDEGMDFNGQEVFDELEAQEADATDPLREELEGFIEGLSEDEQLQMVALALIGRGDYDKAEWDVALEAASDRGDTSASDYLLGMPMLADYLEEGLDGFGLSCSDFDEARM